MTNTATVSTQTDDQALAHLEEAKPCQTLSEDCDHPATWMIWANHHKQGCPSYSYRCDVHFNLLHLELRRMLGSIERGVWVTCGECGQLLTSCDPADYVRGIRL